MEFLNNDGNVIMYNEDGCPVTVLTIRNGVMLSLINKAKLTRAVTIYPGAFGLQDTWLFHQDKTIPIHNVQTRDVIPALAKVYYDFLKETKDYSLDDFVSRIVADYFIGVLKFTLPPGLITKEFLK